MVMNNTQHKAQNTDTEVISVPVLSLVEQWNDAGEYHIQALGRLGGYQDAPMLMAQRWVAQEASGMRETAKYAPLALQGLVHSMMRERRVNKRDPLKRVVVEIRKSDNQMGRFDVDLNRATWLHDFSRLAFAEVHALGGVRDAQGSEERNGLDVDGVHGVAVDRGGGDDGVRTGAEREGMGGTPAQTRREAGADGGDGDARAAGGGQEREAEQV